ncbi:MAG: hypothetical protein ACRCTI_14365, partial [Beijerinckiaceae bacterium]
MRSIRRIARPADLDGHADVSALHDLWLSLRDGSGLPRMSALRPEALDWCRDQLEIMVPAGDGRLIFAHHGRNLATAAGVVLTGKTTVDFRPDARAFFEECYALAFDSRQPVFAISESALVTPVHTWRRHHFPLYQDDGTPACALGLMLPAKMRHDVWRAMSHIAGFGAGTLEPMQDERGNVYDFLIMETADLAPLLGDDTPQTLNPLLRRQLDAPAIARLLAAAPGEILLSETLEVACGAEKCAAQVDVLSSDMGLILNVRDVTTMRMAQSLLEKRTEELRLAQQLGRIGG